MFESVINAVDLRAVAIFAGFLLVVFVPGLWYVKKTTGRPWRDMLASLSAGFVLVLLFVPVAFLFQDPLHSPDRHTRGLAYNILSVLFGVLAVVIWWAFNMLAKRRSTLKRREHHNEPG